MVCPSDLEVPQQIGINLMLPMGLREPRFGINRFDAKSQVFQCFDLDHPALLVIDLEFERLGQGNS